MIGKLKGWKKPALLAAAALCAAVLTDGIWWFLAPGGFNYTQSGNVRELEMTMGETVETVAEDSLYSPSGKTMETLFDLEGTPAGSVVVRVAEPDARDRYVSVALVAEGQEISQAALIHGRITAGSQAIGISLADRAGETLLVSRDAGIEIMGISVSDGDVTKSRIPYRPRFPRIGLIFGGLLLAVCLVLYVPGVKRGLRWLDRNLLARESRLRWVDAVYMGFALVALFHHIYVTLVYPTWLSGAEPCGGLLIAFAIVSALLGKMWKNRGFWLFLCIWLLYFFRLALPDPDRLSLANASGILIAGAYGFFGCYSVPFALKERDRKPFLKTFCLLWTALVGALSLLGVYSAYTGVTFVNFAGGEMNVRGGRLYLFYYCVTSGVLVSVSAMLALYCLTLVKRPWARILLIFAGLVMILANALTGTRTGFVMTGAGVALMICLWVNQNTGLSIWKGSRGRRLGNGLALLAVLVVAAAGVAYAQSFLSGAFVTLRERGFLVGRAWAEDAAAPVLQAHIAERGFQQIDNLDSMSSGRITIWNAALRDLLANKFYLLLGRSVLNTMSGVTAITGYPFTHCHNLLLQIWVESGVLGLCFSVGVIILIVVCGVRLCRNSAAGDEAEKKSWKWMLIVPLAALFVGEMAECTTIWMFCQPQETLLYLLAGFVAALGAKAEQPLKRK